MLMRIAFMPYSVIVDGYSAGNRLAPLFAGHGIECIHIQTVFQAHNYYLQSFNRSDYHQCLDYRGDYEQLLKQLSNYQITSVIAGCDMGIELVDRLNDSLSLQGNSPALSKARRDKYAQRKYLSKHGLTALNYLNTDCLNKLRNWAKKEGFPVVLKPLSSASSQDIKMCSSLNEISNAYHRIMQRGINDQGEMNQSVLAETYLEGKEYRVNTVSWNGIHTVTDIWETSKTLNQQGDFLYDCFRMLPSQGDIQKELTEYLFKVNDALEIQHGPCTADIIMTKEGPALVEIGARLMGEILPTNILHKSLEHNQIDLTAMAYADPAAYSRVNQKNYELKHHLIAYFVQSTQTGKLASFNFTDEINALPSVAATTHHVSVGDELFVTTDYSSSPLHIIFSHTSHTQLEKDYQTAKEYVMKGLFNTDQ
jgi:biotin carboxylase